MVSSRAKGVQAYLYYHVPLLRELPFVLDFFAGLYQSTSPLDTGEGAQMRGFATGAPPPPSTPGAPAPASDWEFVRDSAR